ncbi:MAG: amidohydrolase, partial [Candidatus Bipolaricaulota bacterium]|nr:amidohydrolase [Candidatus Bipolaricaulota bacterium]
MSDAKTRAAEAVDALEGRLRSVSREIFEPPEEKCDEVRASKLLADELRAAGFEVEVGTAGLPTAIQAVHPAAAPGPTVAILGEYDALPELGHACGHNLIAAGALGAA